MLTATILLLTAFVAGVTGAWSPCGFSMVETLGSARSHAGMRTVRTSCVTFALGALAGGAITFTALAAVGALLGGADSDAALVVAATVALSCAFGELLGVRIVPQIRRQVPEPWRRTMPLPLAAGLYGVLLGLGFTTFVLTLAVWALAGVSVAIGDPVAGLLIGLGFGAGRALPVVLLAPRYATLGERLETRMCEQPALLRSLRLADGALLAVLAVVLLASGTASAAAGPVARQAHDGAEAARAQHVADGATDPSIAPGTLAWLGLDGHAIVASGAARTTAPAQNAAIGGVYLATRSGDTITVIDRASGALVAQRTAPGTTQLAVSDQWLVWRTTRRGGGDRLEAAQLPGLADVRVVAGVRKRKRIGRPALVGDHLAYAVAERHESRIVVDDLAGGTRRVLLRARFTQLSQPALNGGRLLYVQSTFCTQRLRVTSTGKPGSSRTLLTLGTNAHRDSGHEHHYSAQGSEPGHCRPHTPPRTDTVLWTTALGVRDAYVTLLHPGTAAGEPPQATLVRVGL